MVHNNSVLSMIDAVLIASFFRDVVPSKQCSLDMGTTTLAVGTTMRTGGRATGHDGGYASKLIDGGDLIDCVPSHLQPAFDHPKLRGQKPLDPPERPAGGFNVSSSTVNEVSLISFGFESCPPGTVPIRRTTQEDILRASSIRQFGKKPVRRDSTGSDHEHAVGYVVGNRYYGAKASLSVWAPAVTSVSEFSLSQIWLISGSFGDDLNTIEAGWQVNPQLHGDGRPRFFTYWTSDAYQQTGCYNLLCSGFVQTSNKIALGAAISPTSALNGVQFDIDLLIWKGHLMKRFSLRVIGMVSNSTFIFLYGKLKVTLRNGSARYSIVAKGGIRHTVQFNIDLLIWKVKVTLPNGSARYSIVVKGGIRHSTRSNSTLIFLYGRNDVQFDIDLLIWKDPKHGHWWLELGSRLVVGYWPAFLFSHLAEHANMVQFGGETVNTRSLGLHTSTQMGSGHFAEEGFRRASYFRNLQLVDWDNNLIPLSNLRLLADHPNCYSIRGGANGAWGSYFYYGGPGGNMRCR
ncbi:hypothetical protein ZIOFF_063840 [Zingiber officinale]|uniref:Neprosin PEP catalytic domain-containing protein n=1 Tax=Zingiber officinale TaxID=94328 RepID=A0A8J5K9Y1_ZINOF|nr:hypothetical protein ZIOFF_063840 [Zingiber officinale]